MSGPSPLRTSRIDAASGLAALFLAILAEGAWIAVLGNFIGLIARDAAPSFAVVTALVGIGVAACRRVGPRLGAPLRRSSAAVLVVTGAVAAAWLGRPIGTDQLGIAGLVGGLAVARGLRYGDQPLDEDALRHLLGVGAAVIVCATLAADLTETMRGGLASGDPLGALWLGATFAIGSILALAITREQLAAEQASLGSSASPDWLRTTILVVLLATVVGIPASAVLASVVELTVVALLVIWLIAGLLFGWTRRAVAMVIGGPIVVFGLISLMSFITRFIPHGGPLGGIVAPATTQPPAIQPPAISADIVAAVFLGLGGLVIVAFIVLAWGRSRGRSRSTRTRAETRVIDHSRDEPGWGVGRWLRSALPLRPSPRTAEEAYLALIRDLDGRIEVERGPSETPQEHARRLRREGAGNLSLDLLAADYALIRFGGGRVTAREDRRSVNRWHWLRTTIRAHAAEVGRQAAERAGQASLDDDDETAEQTETETQMPSRSLRS